MASTKDYYQILGINKNATADEIKQAYKKMAKEHHPDMVKDGDKATAEARFKEINEAYQILSDPQKRTTYDQYGSSAFTGGANGAQPGGPGGQWGPFTYSYTSGGQGENMDFDPFDVFEQFFGSRGFGGQARGPRKGKNLYYEMRINFADAVFGLEKEIQAESGKVTIKIPAGVRDGTELRFMGKGMPSTNGGQQGDLYISIRLNKPATFDIVDENIFVQQEIDFVTAILGGSVEIPVVDLTDSTGLGKEQLKIPEGTQFGAKLVLKGKGMPRLQAKGQGDVIIQVFFKTPKKISKQQKELLEKYRTL